MIRDQRGFTLVETLCALLVLSLAVLLIGQLSQVARSLERQADIQFAVSREANNSLATLQARTRIAEVGVHQRDLHIAGIPVHETERITEEGELLQITLVYAWQEGGRGREQRWDLLQSR